MLEGIVQYACFQIETNCVKGTLPLISRLPFVMSVEVLHNVDKGLINTAFLPYEMIAYSNDIYDRRDILGAVKYVPYRHSGFLRQFF